MNLRSLNRGAWLVCSSLGGMLNSERDVRAFPKILATSGSKKETNITPFSLDLLPLCKILRTTLRVVSVRVGLGSSICDRLYH